VIRFNANLPGQEDEQEAEGNDLGGMENKEVAETEETLAKQKDKIDDLKNVVSRMREELTWEQQEFVTEEKPKVHGGFYRV